MPGKKPPPKKPRAASGPAWQVILEEMRSQNRATIEAVQSTRTELKQEIAELRENTTARFQTLESAVRQISTDLQGLRKEVVQNGAEIRRVDEKLDGLPGLEARVSALERKRG